MDIIAAYREAGTYRGAAEIAGTTHKTVRRVIARYEAGGAAPERAPRGRNYAGGGVCRVTAQLPASGRGGQGGLAAGASPEAPPGGVVTG